MSTDKIRNKIVLLGEFSVGKTSLIRRFVYGLFDEEYITTIGTVIKRKTISDIEPFEVELLIWDIMGTEDVADVPDSYIKGAVGGFIVCDLTRRETIQKLQNWAEHFISITDEKRLIVVGNKRDLLPEQEIDDYAKPMNKIAADYETSAFITSAKTGTNVEEMFHQLAELLVTRVKKGTNL